LQLEDYRVFREALVNIIEKSTTANTAAFELLAQYQARYGFAGTHVDGQAKFIDLPVSVRAAFLMELQARTAAPGTL
jgi:hypothetical protein